VQRFFLPDRTADQTIREGTCTPEVPYALKLRSGGRSKGNQLFFPQEGRSRLSANLYRNSLRQYPRRNVVSGVGDRNALARTQKALTMEKLILDGHKLNWHRERIEAWLAGSASPHHHGLLPDACLHLSLRLLLRPVAAQRHQADDPGRHFPLPRRCRRDRRQAISFVSDGESTCSPHCMTPSCAAVPMAWTWHSALTATFGKTTGSMRSSRHDLPPLQRLRRRAGTVCGDPWLPRSRIPQSPGNGSQDHGNQTRHNLPVTVDCKWCCSLLRRPDHPPGKLGKELGVDYLVIKHCSDDEHASLGVDYAGYHRITDLLQEAETYAEGSYQVSVKWSKILSDGKRTYTAASDPPSSCSSRDQAWSPLRHAVQYPVQEIPYRQHCRDLVQRVVAG